MTRYTARERQAGSSKWPVSRGAYLAISKNTGVITVLVFRITLGPASLQSCRKHELSRRKKTDAQKTEVQQSANLKMCLVGTRYGCTRVLGMDACIASARFNAQRFNYPAGNARADFQRCCMTLVSDKPEATAAKLERKCGALLA